MCYQWVLKLKPWGPVVRSALGGGEPLCGDVDFCWLPEVQTVCHQVVKRPTRQRRQSKTAWREDRNGCWVISKSVCTLRRPDAGPSRDIMGSLCEKVQVDTAKVRGSRAREVAKAAGLWVQERCLPALPYTLSF